MRTLLFPLLSLFFMMGCTHLSSHEKIARINIIDRNGMAETISNKDRLNALQKNDFLSPQPYQKVHRVYGRNENGDVLSKITSYHPNGSVKQYLEAVNNRALGPYKEWHPNGKLKIESYVIGGIADLNTAAEESWLFDGKNQAWDEDGNSIAEIFYSKGELEGLSKYTHPNGNVWKLIPFTKNEINGTEKIYLPDGTLFQTTEYKNGCKEGASVRYWAANHIAYQELYQGGLLWEAEYFDKNGLPLSSVHGGEGFRAILGKDRLQELQEYHAGHQEGVVKILGPAGELVRAFSTKNGEKHGEEIDYFPTPDHTLKPKLLISWYEGSMEGPVKTWYETGDPESQKEICHNKKNGLSSAWYADGSLMFVEEYDNDILLKGEYYKKGEKAPISKVEKGSGIATLFNGDGLFSKKIHYQSGKPLA